MPSDLRQELIHKVPFRFENGAACTELRLAYWTLGHLNSGASNAVLLCHNASGNKDWALPFCRPGGAFDPQRWFIISVDVPGGGGSSRLRDSKDFPPSYTVADLSAAMSSLIDGLRLPSVRAFGGPSMASLIGLDLAFRHPGKVRSLLLWNGGYRCDGFGRAVADALCSILESSDTAVGMRVAIKAFLPVLLERETLAGMNDVARARIVDRLTSEWVGAWRADELAARYRAVADCDLAISHGGEVRLAAGIQCPVLSLCAAGDLIFPPSQMAGLTELMPKGELRRLASSQGHIANLAAPDSAEFAFFDTHTADFLKSLPA